MLFEHTQTLKKELSASHCYVESVQTLAQSYETQDAKSGDFRIDTQESNSAQGNCADAPQLLKKASSSSGLSGYSQADTGRQSKSVPPCEWFERPALYDSVRAQTTVESRSVKRYFGGLIISDLSRWTGDNRLS